MWRFAAALAAATLTSGLVPRPLVAPGRVGASARGASVEVVDVVPEEEDGVAPLPEAEGPEDGGGFTGPRWRVVSAWAKWERSGILAHVSRDDVEALRELLAAAAPAVAAGGGGGGAAAVDPSLESALEARLEIVEALLSIGADGEACAAAFLSAGGWAGDANHVADARPLLGEVTRLRRVVSEPVAASQVDAPAAAAATAALVATGGDPMDAWLAIDAYASGAGHG